MKKAISFALALCMTVMALAGCGSPDSTTTDQKGSTANGAAETVGDEKADENAGAKASGGASFKIGGIGPITGGTAVYGLAVKNGAQLAIDEINAAGGINGAQLEFNFQDDENDAEKSVNAYNALKDWNMQILMGTVTSTPCVAVAQESNNDSIFQLTPSGSSVPCVQYDNAFRICFSDPNQGLKSAQYIGENKLASKVAVIYDSSDVYSNGIYETFTAEVKNQNIEIVAAEAFTADSKTDFTVQLQKAKDAGAELLFLPIYYAEASLILAQANTMGFAPQFFGCDGLDGILSVDNFDTKLAEDVMLLTPFAADAQDEKTKAFTTTFESKFGGTPNQFAADAYDAIYTIKAAIEKSGVTPDKNAQDICDALKTAMTEITVDGLTGAGMTWTADGEVNKSPKAVIIKNGVYTAM